jgi:mannose-6-phosphate isomerase-like protein (cupin superfamily)
VADYTVKRIDDMEAIAGGSFKRARAELGVEAWGMQVMDIPPNIDLYPEHDHAESGQEEVYVTLRGSAEIDIDGESVTLEPDVMVRVGPEARRKVVTHDDPIRMLIIGGTPGKAYEFSEAGKLGGPDPGVPQRQS